MRVYVYLAGLGVCLLAAGLLTLCAGTTQQDIYTEELETNPHVTIRPPATPSPPEDPGVLPLCPPRPTLKGRMRSNLLLVSTLDGQLSALDLDKDGEMFWSVSTFPGPMLSSTISDMDLDNRGQFVKLIPSLTGRLYKFNGEMVEPIPMDVDSLLGTSLRMQENVVVTGGKESRTYGILKDTGELLYECSMNDCTNFQDENTTKDILVVQRTTQTVRAHGPRTGEQKWNFSVSLHDLAFHPSDDPCKEEEEEDDIIETSDDFTLKAVVPEGIICATRERSQDNQDIIKWKRKFITPIVDVWRLKNGELSKINLFSKNHIPKRNILLDDDDDTSDDENPSLYIGKHNNQLYIQESIHLRRDTDTALNEYTLNPAETAIDYPRVSWKPYLISPSRTPVINHGSTLPDSALISFDQTIRRGDSKTTALAITANNAEYPYDAGFYLYPDTTALDTDDTLANITSLREEQNESVDPENTVEYIYMGLSHYWKEIIFISLLTAVMMNVLITRPIIHEMRDNFQEKSRELVQHIQTIQSQKELKEVVREVFVEVPVPSNSMGPNTPSTGSGLSGSGPDFSGYDRQTSEFSSRYLTDFEPVQCLGRGGFGVVFESKNKYDDIHYAVKRITLPSSENSKKKVMREVKLHAKLDHRNIVRYYSTWLETPPPGWQEQADAWFDETDLGTGPTPFDPSTTDYSMSEAPKGRKAVNPLKPFTGYNPDTYSKGSSPGFRLPAAGQTDTHRTCDNSFSIRFEDSNSDNEGDEGSDDSDDGEDCSNEEDIEFIQEESTGGIMFKADDTNEIKGEAEGVALDIDTSNGPIIQFNKSESSESLSCCEAINWNGNQSSVDTEAKRKAKTYLYIVMQLCKKETLRDWLRNNSVREESTVLSFFHQICVGVQYVHRQGLIHRDLKPSNIYFAADGTIKIGDFGLVTGLSQEEGGAGDTAARTGSTCDDQLTDQVGTQLYMSPEQLAQKPYNHKVDIFSLGLIFLELLVAFSTQMERLHALSNVKKGRYPVQLADKAEYTNLLGLMLNPKSDLRPEAHDILQLPWLQSSIVEEVPVRIRQDTVQEADLSSYSLQDTHTRHTHTNILSEELLDN